MARFNGTAELDRADLEGTAFLLNARRAERGLPLLEGAALKRAARVAHFAARVDTARDESGRRRSDRRRDSVGVRVGLSAPASDGAEGAATHADPRAHDPAKVEEAADILRRVAGILTPVEARLVFGKAAGFDVPDLAARDKRKEPAVRQCLCRARAKVAAALLPGGALADLGAEGYAILAPKGGRRE